jgi:pimeloyl-ACP methyl ester carboxylesterase
MIILTVRITVPPRTRTATKTPIYDPRVQHITFDSSALGVAKSFYIFVPNDLPAGERVPTLYLLRGHEREWVNPREDDSRGGINVVDVYLRLRESNPIQPLILVFPGLASSDNRIPSVLANMRAPELAQESEGIGSGRFEDYFFEDLIPFVDEQFPSAGGRARGIAGFSLGGAMAMKAAVRRPDLFSTASAYDGTFLYARGGGSRVRTVDGVIANPMFDPAYGTPRDMHFVADNSASNLVLRSDPTTLASITWMVSYGPRRLEPWHANYYRGEHFVRCLRTRGCDNAISPDAILNRDHNWRTADAFMEFTLPLHSRILYGS